MTPQWHSIWGWGIKHCFVWSDHDPKFGVTSLLLCNMLHYCYVLGVSETSVFVKHPERWDWAFTHIHIYPRSDVKGTGLCSNWNNIQTMQQGLGFRTQSMNLFSMVMDTVWGMRIWSTSLHPGSKVLVLQGIHNLWLKTSMSLQGVILHPKGVEASATSSG